MNRRAYLSLAGALVVIGLLFRLGPWHLALAVHHFGGGVLWGAMIYSVVAAFRRPHWGARSCFVVSLVVITAVELSRSLHTPALDAFRLTLPGQLLLGHVYAPSNILFDAAGALAVALWSSLRADRLAPAAHICEERA